MTELGEQEVDLARYARALSARWWLPLLGLIGGLAVGYAMTVGGTDVWRARALVYLGQPLHRTGAQVQSLATNPSVVPEVIRSEAAIATVAESVGMKRDELRRGVTSQAVDGSNARLGQTPLVSVSVTGASRFKSQAAANRLAEIVVDRVDDYAEAKIDLLQEQVAASEEEISAIDRRIRGLEGAGTSALALAGFLEERRGLVRETLLDARADLALAQTVERSRIVERAVARKATARSRRNALVVGALIGLLLGSAAALLWEPVARTRV